MTICGALSELNNLMKADNIPIYYKPSIKSVMDTILEQDSKVGHWIDDDGDNAICSCCNRLNHLYGSYCKHCGAKME